MDNCKLVNVIKNFVKDVANKYYTIITTWTDFDKTFGDSSRYLISTILFPVI